MMSDKASRNDRALPGEGTTVALVLGSGGARGYAHIGVIEVLREQGITSSRFPGPAWAR